LLGEGTTNMGEETKNILKSKEECPFPPIELALENFNIKKKPVKKTKYCISDQMFQYI